MHVLVDIETLRRRFHLAKAGRGHEIIAEAVGVVRATLDAFVAGQRVGLRTLEKIYEWCEQEESMNGYTVVRRSRE